MNILKSFGVVIVIFVLRGLLALRGKKIIPIKAEAMHPDYGYLDEPTIDIPIKRK